MSRNAKLFPENPRNPKEKERTGTDGRGGGCEHEQALDGVVTIKGRHGLMIEGLMMMIRVNCAQLNTISIGYFPDNLEHRKNITVDRVEGSDSTS
jgi:hypothetical protein